MQLNMKTPFDPRQSTLVARADAFVSVPLERLQASGLRRHFAAAPVWHPEICLEPALAADANAGGAEKIAAAVLIPLVSYQDRLRVLLTRRTDHLHDHAGQISFPGGRSQVEDAQPEATALRETQEEIGLPAQQIEVLGRLPDYHTATGYCVTPIVGLMSAPLALQLESFEVAEAFEVPLDFLMDARNHQLREITVGANTRRFYVMQYQDNQSQNDQSQREYFIWGATAGMLRNLYRFLLA